MDNTTYYNLGKPLGTEQYDVAIPNANMDAIDTELHLQDNRLDVAEASIVTINGALNGAGAAYPVTNVPRCRLRQTAVQATATNVPEYLDMATAAIDYDYTTAMADKANDRIVIKKAGLYTITLRAVWDNNATGDRFALIDKDTGGTVTQLAEDYRRATANTNTIITLTTEPIPLLVNDRIKGRVSQTSGGNLNMDTANGRFSALSVCYVGPSA